MPSGSITYLFSVSLVDFEPITRVYMLEGVSSSDVCFPELLVLMISNVVHRRSADLTAHGVLRSPF